MRPTPHRTLIGGLLLALSVNLPGAVGREWTHLAADAAHTGTAPFAPPTLDTVAWSATPSTVPDGLEQFVWRSGVVATGERVFITARQFTDDGTGLLEPTTNLLICYDAKTGIRRWATPIDADTSGFDSWATPVIDRVNDTVIAASNFSLSAIDLTDGTPRWEAELPRVLVNASPTVSQDLANHGVPANRVFITDYTGFDPSGGGVYAVNTSPYNEVGNPYEPGEIVWQDRTLPGTSGNTVAYADGFVYVATTHGGVIRAYAALDGGTSGLNAVPAWETDTGISQLAQYAGFYGGVAVRDGYVYAAGYNFYGSGSSSRLFKLAADDGELIWEQPCERTNSIPIVTATGRIYLSAGIDGFGSTVTVQAFQDHGSFATQLWDTDLDTGGSLVVGGWTLQPLFAAGRLYAGTPDSSAFFGPYTDLLVLDVNRAPGDPDFVVDHASGSGGTPATTGRFLYSLGTNGLVAYRGCGAGDVDGDGDIDGDDVTTMFACMPGPDIGDPPGGCTPAAFNCADIDQDGDVDLVDLAVVQAGFGVAP